MKRNPRKVKWTKAYRAIHGKDLSADNIFNFERRRNRPVRYNRELTHKTLAALRTVDEIRTKRDKRHYEQRMKGISDRVRRKDKSELQKQVHLVKAPTSAVQIAQTTREKVAVSKYTSLSILYE